MTVAVVFVPPTMTSTVPDVAMPSVENTTEWKAFGEVNVANVVPFDTISIVAPACPFTVAATQPWLDCVPGATTMPDEPTASSWPPETRNEPSTSSAPLPLLVGP